MSVRVLIAATAFLLVTPQVHGAKAHQVRPSHQTQRLIAVSENGPIVTLRLENGASVDVARSKVKVKEEERSAQTRAARKAQKKRVASVARLSEMSAANPAGLPALVTLSYKRDGSVKKARVRLFASEAAMRTYLAQREERLAAARAAQSKEPHR
jgi:hypothetical protein